MRATTAQREWPMYRQPSRRDAVARFWRDVAGAVAAGLTLLAAGLFGVLMFAHELGVQGPGAQVAAGHAAAAMFAIAFAILADRTRGRPAVVGVIAVFVITAATLWWYWLR
ncbi:MAG: hypothetical protein GEV00_08235 [Actinophytocola sp.]|nr:hypothetical protein [Actinophytocola sp.]